MPSSTTKILGLGAADGRVLPVHQDLRAPGALQPADTEDPLLVRTLALARQLPPGDVGDDLLGLRAFRHLRPWVLPVPQAVEVLEQLHGFAVGQRGGWPGR